jgi:hypothetical protein
MGSENFRRCGKVAHFIASAMQVETWMKYFAREKKGLRLIAPALPRRSPFS